GRPRAKWRKLANTYSAMGRLFVSPREVVTKTSEPQRSVSRKLLAPAGSSCTHFKRGARARRFFSGGQPVSTISAEARASLRSSRLLGGDFLAPRYRSTVQCGQVARSSTSNHPLVSITLIRPSTF